MKKSAERVQRRSNRFDARERQRTVFEENGSAEQSDMSSNFHISIGWSLRKPSEEIIRKLDQVTDEDLSGLRLEVNSIKIKIGNTVTAVPLTSGLELSNGILQI